jgi:rhodanese-related sulfurtransferase
MSIFSKLFKTETNIKSISATALKQLLQEDNNLKVIDVRTSDEYKQGHLHKATNIDVFSSDFVKKCESKFKHTDKLILYCRSGQRSMNAAKKLELARFESLYNLKGGFISWSKN